jgi:membrane associated rhomboid family serine protease
MGLVLSAAQAQSAINDQTSFEGTAARDIQAYGAVNAPRPSNTAPAGNKSVGILGKVNLATSPKLWTMLLCLCVPFFGVQLLYGSSGLSMYFSEDDGQRYACLFLRADQSCLSEDKVYENMHKDAAQLFQLAAQHRIGMGDWAMMRCGGLTGLFELRRLILQNFLHSGFEHLAGNMFGLAFGLFIESKYGSGFTWVIFLSSALLGSLFSIKWFQMCVGASTICFGITGAMLSMYAVYYPKIEATARLSVIVLIVSNCVEVAMQVLMTQLGALNISHMAHLGGFVAGALVYFGRRRQWCLQVFAGIFVVTIIYASAWPPASDESACDLWPAAYKQAGIFAESGSGEDAKDFLKIMQDVLTPYTGNSELSKRLAAYDAYFNKNR